MIRRLTIISLVLFILFLQAYTHAGDAFFKGGIMLKPDGDIDFKHKWRLSFGSDYMKWDQIGAGFEIQLAYSSEDIVNETFYYIPLNVFVNVKYKTATEGIRAFGGGGIGMLSKLIFDGDSTWYKRIGIHAVGGAEFGSLEQTAFVVELQLIKPISGDEPKDTEVLLLAGIKW